MKNFIKSCFVLLIVLFLVACNTETNEKKVINIEVDLQTNDEYFDLDSYNLSDIKLIVLFSDNTEEVIVLEEKYILEDDRRLLSIEGNHLITITVYDYTTKININLKKSMSTFESIYNLALASSSIENMTYEEWLETIKGDKGNDGLDGRVANFRVTNEFIQYSYDDENWTNLLPTEVLMGQKGKDGKEIIVNVNNSKLEWKYDGDASWNHLFDLESMKGKDGLTPYIGENGNWFIGEIDTLHKAIGEKGDPGKDGLTPYVGENGNWFIGNEDTNVPSVIIPENMDRIGTDGLYFFMTIKDGIAGYEVTGYQGVHKDIIIPNEIMGIKVISIAPNALPQDIVSISISKHTISLPSFQSYSYLETVDFNHAPLNTILDYGFQSASNLKNILNYENIENIGSYAFSNTKILYTDFDFTNIKNIGTYAFRYSGNDYDFDGLIYDRVNKEFLEKNFIYLSKDVKTIGYKAFDGSFPIYYEGNNQVDFSEELFVKNVKKTDDGYWYTDQGSYISILNYTGALKEITIPEKIDNKTVQAVADLAFIGDNNLTRINLPKTINSIGYGAFILTRKLYIIHIPSSVINISEAMFGVWEHTNNDVYGNTFAAAAMIFENSQENMNLGSNTIDSYRWGRYAFGYKAEEIKQDSSFVYIEKDSYAEILAIKNTNGNVTIPSSYNEKIITRINQYALHGHNGGVKSVHISEGIQYISTKAFYNSTTLKLVTIPSSMQAVNYRGFFNLTNAIIFSELTTKPANWDSNWYYQTKEIIWNQNKDIKVSNDNLYLYKLNQDNTANIIKYLGNWNVQEVMIIPSYIDGLRVSKISRSAIKYTTAANVLVVFIPKTIDVIENYAITSYTATNIFTDATSKPTTWSAYFVDGERYGNENFYYEGSWTMVDGVPKLK